MTAASGDSGETPQNSGGPHLQGGYPPPPGPTYPAYEQPAYPAYEQPAYPGFPRYEQQPGPYAPPPAGFPVAPPYGGAYFGGPYPAGYNYPAHPAAPPATNTLAILSVVASVVGLFCAVSSVVGIILGAVAISQVKRTRQDGFGLAVAGIIIGVATLLVFLVLVAVTRG